MSGGDFVAGLFPAIDGTAIDDAANSGWVYFDMETAKGLNLFTYATSAGTPALTISLWISPISMRDGNRSHEAADGLGVTTTLSSTDDGTAKWWGDDSNWPDAADRPFSTVGLKIAVADADATAVYAYLTANTGGQ